MQSAVMAAAQAGNAGHSVRRRVRAAARRPGRCSRRRRSRGLLSAVEGRARLLRRRALSAHGRRLSRPPARPGRRARRACRGLARRSARRTDYWSASRKRPSCGRVWALPRVSSRRFDQLRRTVAAPRPTDPATGLMNAAESPDGWPSSSSAAGAQRWAWARSSPISWPATAPGAARRPMSMSSWAARRGCWPPACVRYGRGRTPQRSRVCVPYCPDVSGTACKPSWSGCATGLAGDVRR